MPRLHMSAQPVNQKHLISGKEESMTDKKSKVRVNKTEEAAFYDVVIIGAGVTGAFIARELSKYEASVCLVEKEADVAMGSSKANSAIVHAGYDAEPGSLKARLNVEGNLLMPGVAEELGVPYKNTGSLVVAFSESEAELLGNLMERGRINGVKGLEIIAKDTLQKIEPSISADATAALYAPTAGIVCPYELTIGAVENAVENGVEVKLETEVTGIAFAGDLFEVSTNRGKLFARFVVNAAGLYADKIAGMIGDNSFSIHPRKGEYLLLDKSQGGIVNRVVFQVPNDKGKGILVTPTVDGNLLVGPNAEDIDDKEDAGTTLEGLREVMEKARKSVPGINYREVVTSFSGLRARPTGGDFIIGVSKKNQRFINVAGIESPGLTAAPATGPYVAGILKEQGFALNKKENFNPVRKPAICTRTLAPTLTVSAAAIIAAAVTALVTILISAFIPAHRAAKISAIEAIRQTTDIRLSGKQVRTSPIIRMLFGMEGNLAVKNFRRNKRRYRSTVVSLFISIVLFVSTSAFCKYLVDGTKSVYEVKKYDICYYTGQKKLSDSMMTAFNSILAMEEVSEGQYVKDIFVNSVIPTDKVTETFYNKSLIKGYMRDKESINVGLLICGIQHDAFVKYISDLGLDIKDFENSEILTGVLLDHQHYYEYEEKRYIDMTVFKERKPWPLPVSLYTDKDGYSEIEVYIAAYADWAPLAVDDYSNGNYTTLIVDFDMTNKFYEGIEDNWGDVTLIIKAKDPAKAEVKIKDILIDAGFDTSGLYNAAANMQSTKNIITVMMVFSYGFITLISLIAIANVFNTISTNMNLRRKEFAMLKSVGMTKSGFNKMLNYECVFYGLKSLIYGIPVALLFTWMIFKSLRQGVDIAFQLPVSSILTSVLSVFIVVFVTMIYSMRKIRNENILDALKCENL
jgi:L-2-hydroxyglutarate oxidase LhgO/ABC-type antimicrobial peptide transport system permease subunit